VPGRDKKLAKHAVGLAAGRFGKTFKTIQDGRLKHSRQAGQLTASSSTTASTSRTAGDSSSERTSAANLLPQGSSASVLRAADSRSPAALSTSSASAMTPVAAMAVATELRSVPVAGEGPVHASREAAAGGSRVIGNAGAAGGSAAPLRACFGPLEGARLEQGASGFLLHLDQSPGSFQRAASPGLRIFANYGQPSVHRREKEEEEAAVDKELKGRERKLVGAAGDGASTALNDQAELLSGVVLAGKAEPASVQTAKETAMLPQAGDSYAEPAQDLAKLKRGPCNDGVGMEEMESSGDEAGAATGAEPRKRRRRGPRLSKKPRISVKFDAASNESGAHGDRGKAHGVAGKVAWPYKVCECGGVHHFMQCKTCPKAKDVTKDIMGKAQPPPPPEEEEEEKDGEDDEEEQQQERERESSSQSSLVSISSLSSLSSSSCSPLTPATSHKLPSSSGLYHCGEGDAEMAGCAPQSSQMSGCAPQSSQAESSILRTPCASTRQPQVSVSHTHTLSLPPSRGRATRKVRFEMYANMFAVAKYESLQLKSSLMPSRPMRPAPIFTSDHHVAAGHRGTPAGTTLGRAG
jgi:hypothetical protein